MFQRYPLRNAIGAGELVTVGGYHRGLWQSYPSAIGFFFGNTELSLELWPAIAGISGFDD